MSLVVALALLGFVLVVGTLLWAKVPGDGVGRTQRRRLARTGLHGKVTEWMYWDAAVGAPTIGRYGKDARSTPPEEPVDRALHALVLREAAVANVDLELAYRRLRRRNQTALSQAFLRGRWRMAVRTHWRSRFSGPASLFLPWYYLVAGIRYGRRQLSLETLSAVLKELEQP